MTEHPARPRPKSVHMNVHESGQNTNNLVAGELAEVDSKQLFADAKALVIRHGGERYTLRRTSKGKLILTK